MAGSGRVWSTALKAAGALLCLGSPTPGADAQPPEPKPAVRHLLEPSLHFTPDPSEPGPVVALTLDACMGAFDLRIADTLVRDRIPATIFATHRWLKHNPEGLALLLAHPDLFEIEDHGDQHVPAVTGTEPVFGLKPAGTIAAVREEVEKGAEAVRDATGAAPLWFRGATAEYSPDAMAEIEAEGFRIAGFSLNADIGASLPAEAVKRRIEGAKSGDVIIAHVNQPHRPSGQGVAEGVEALLKAGYRFVRLEDAFPAETASFSSAHALLRGGILPEGMRQTPSND